MGLQLFHSRSGICIIIAYQRVQHQQRSSHLLRSCLILHLLNRSCSKCMGFLSLLGDACMAGFVDKKKKYTHSVLFAPIIRHDIPTSALEIKSKGLSALTHSLFLFRVGPSRSHLWNSYYQHRGRDGYNLQTTNR